MHIAVCLQSSDLNQKQTLALLHVCMLSKYLMDLILDLVVVGFVLPSKTVCKLLNVM